MDQLLAAGRLRFLDRDSRDRFLAARPGRPAASPSLPDHRCPDREPLWRFLDPALEHPFADPGRRPLFRVYGPDASLDELLEQTGFFVVLGAAGSARFHTLLRRACRLLVLEPDPARLAAHLADLPGEVLERSGVTWIVGPPHEAPDALEDLLGREDFAHGFPAALVQADRPGLAEAWEPALERLEVLHYRHAVAPLSGHAHAHGRPVRALRRGRYYDEQKHFCENLSRYCADIGIEALAGTFAGWTCLLVAAGPALDQSLEYVRRHRHGAVVVCVNKALNPLLRAGVEPHVVVVSDRSRRIVESFRGLDRLERTVLATHCLCTAGGGLFRRVLFFGAPPAPELPAHPELPWHGTVLAAGHALAAHMGCARCVLVGAQYASPDPWSMRYSSDTLEGDTGRAPQESLTDRHPQFMPVRGCGGERLYTTMHFLDASLWLARRARDMARAGGMETVNATPGGICCGPDLPVGPDAPVPGPPAGGSAWDVLDGTACGRARGDSHACADLAARELERWRGLARECREAAARDRLDDRALALFRRLEQGGEAYMVQRFPGYDNAAFHAGFLESADPEEQRRSLRTHFQAVADMAETLAGILEQGAGQKGQAADNG